MSTYDKALKRIRLERVTEPSSPSSEVGNRLASTAATRTATESDAQSLPRDRSGEPVDALFVALLDMLLVPGEAGRGAGVVICGASDRENVEAISGGLERATRERQLKTQAVRLLGTQGGPVLRPLASHGGWSSQAPLLAELEAAEVRDRSQVLAALVQWAEHSRSTHDFVLVEAPPLSVNVDGPVLARSFSGLVIVFEPLATTKEALTKGVSRARAAGCELLGLVTSGYQTPLPLPVRQALSRL